jgi:hypothetical protein
MAISGSTKLLIPESPLLVLPTLARQFGVNEAIVLQQVHFYTQRSHAYSREGYRWVFNSYPAWQQHFPFWSVATIKRIFQRLERQGVLISAQFKRRDWDQKKYYRVDYDRLGELVGQNIGTLPMDHSRWDQDDPIKGDHNAPLDGINLTPSIRSGCADVDNTKNSTKTSTDIHTSLSSSGALPSPRACVSSPGTIDFPTDADVQEFLDGWNQICGAHGLPAVTRPTPALRRQIAAALRRNPDREFWELVLNKCVDAPFLRGEGPRGWQVTLPWLVANEDHAIQVYEGNYDGLSAKKF